LRDGERLWFTITTRHWPISEAFSPLGGPYLSDGYIVLFDQAERDRRGRTRLRNEVRIDARRHVLYAVENIRAPHHSLSHRRRWFAHASRDIRRIRLGTFPDGMAFDAEGALWVASIISNRVIASRPMAAARRDRRLGPAFMR